MLASIGYRQDPSSSGASDWAGDWQRQVTKVIKNERRLEGAMNVASLACRWRLDAVAVGEAMELKDIIHA
jgi:hypothetical protein